MLSRLLVVLGLIIVSSLALAQDRDTKVRRDREAFGAAAGWIYNNLDEGVAAALKSGKPLLVAFRCIPCEACQEFDDDVARRDPVIRDLLDEFVCVRIVQANALDLTRFQYDFDQSFAVILMNPDGTIYGRFGTRSDRPEEQDISLEGLRAAMSEALRIHRLFPQVKPSLAGKQPRPTAFRTPREYPSLAGRYREALDYEGAVAKSCIHCHQVREAERLVVRASGEPMPDEVLYPYPDPEVLGLTMDPTACAKVMRVAADSPAAKAGLEAGDTITTLDDQPLLSIADLQWILHNTPRTARLAAVVARDRDKRTLTIPLEAGWRRGNISWRATSWDLRRMALGGMKVVDLSDDAREPMGLGREGLAALVEHVGEYGEHAQAKQAGFRKGDVLIAFDGQSRRMSESDLFAYALQKKRLGDTVNVVVLRDGRKSTFELTLR